ncbi:MAG: hypothetical protein MI861_26240, partial [Pirellulales bacterium]|nr:hypothetical protein [Pirellulales bacterium]
MSSPNSTSYKQYIFNIHKWYLNRRPFFFKAAIALMIFLAVTRIAHHIWRLLLDQSPEATFDLRTLNEWVILWFAGEPLIETILLPATYAILWPLLGWLSFESARWFWALLYLISLTWLYHIVIRECGIKKRGEKLFAALFLLSVSSTGISIGNGQVILFLLPVIVTAVLLEERKEKGLVKDFIVSMLFLFSLLKIPISAPFLLIPLISQRAIRALFITACGYLALTLFSISFRDQGLYYILHEWIRDSSNLAVAGGYANLHIWLGYLGLKNLILPLSFVSLIALGLWLYAYRKTDIWIQLGVAAIVAR